MRAKLSSSRGVRLRRKRQNVLLNLEGVAVEPVAKLEIPRPDPVGESDGGIFQRLSRVVVGCADARFHGQGE